MAEIEVPQGTLHVRDDGDGPPIVFIHGLLVDGRLWDDVAAPLRDHARVVVPDLPLGSHRRAMRPDADLTPPGLANLIADLLERLDLDDVTLVANDTGGALAQLLVTARPERVGRLVLTPCDCFENFPPPMFRPLQYVGGYVPGALRAIAAATRSDRQLTGPLAFGPMAKRHRPDLYRSWLEPARSDAAVRRDLRKVFRAMRPRYTLQAAERLPGFDRPALIAWAGEDRFFPDAHAKRLAELLPQARLEIVEDSRTFIPLDQPARLAELIAGFIPARRPDARASAANGAGAPAAAPAGRGRP